MLSCLETHESTRILSFCTKYQGPFYLHWIKLILKHSKILWPRLQIQVFITLTVKTKAVETSDLREFSKFSGWFCLWKPFYFGFKHKKSQFSSKQLKKTLRCKNVNEACIAFLEKFKKMKLEKDFKDWWITLSIKNILKTEATSGLLKIRSRWLSWGIKALKRSLEELKILPFLIW